MAYTLASSSKKTKKSEINEDNKSAQFHLIYPLLYFVCAYFFHDHFHLLTK